MTEVRAEFADRAEGRVGLAAAGAEIAKLLGIGVDAVDPQNNVIGRGFDPIRMMALAGGWRRQGPWTAMLYGVPFPNSSCWVVNASSGDCPDWVTGELWMGGRSIARGYRGKFDGRAPAGQLAASVSCWIESADQSSPTPVQGALAAVLRQVLPHRSTHCSQIAATGSASGPG